MVATTAARSSSIVDQNRREETLPADVSNGHILEIPISARIRDVDLVEQEVVTTSS